MYACEAGCGHAEWVVILIATPSFLCSKKACAMMQMATERGVPARVATLKAAAMELLCHYTAANGVAEQRLGRRDPLDEKAREFERLHWRNRAAE